MSVGEGVCGLLCFDLFIFVILLDVSLLIFVLEWVLFGFVDICWEVLLMMM